ncbi:MAG: AsmA-like C-terminal domain-containing protein [Pseudomonadota bacterium]
MILRISRAFCKIIGFMAFGLIVAGLVFALRLSIAPIPLDFLKDNVEASLSAKDGSYRVRMDRLLLTWEGIVGGLGFAVVGAKVTDAENAVVGEIPKATMGLSFRALARGVLAPKRIAVQSPLFKLVRQLEDKAAPEGAAIGALVASFFKPSGTSDFLAYLKELRLIGADVRIEDQKLEISWWLPRVDLHLRREEEGVSGSYAIELEMNAIRTRFTGEVNYGYAAENFRVSVQIRDVVPAMFAMAVPLLDQVSGLRLPVSGNLDLSLFSDGRLEEIRFDLSTGKGEIVVPGFYDEGLEIAAARLKGKMGGDFERFGVEELFVDLGGPTLAASLQSSGDGGRLEGSVEARHVPVNHLPRLWPQGMAENARMWIEGHLSGGAVEKARADFQAVIDSKSDPALQVGAVSGTLEYYGIDVVYAEGFPSVTGVGGTATFDLGNMDFAVTEGAHEGLKVTSGTLHLYGLENGDEHAKIDLAAEGPVRGALETLDRPKLRYLQKMGLSVDRFDGEAAILLHIAFPLLNDLRLEDVEVAAEAELRRLSFKDAIPGVDLKEGNLRLKLEGETLAVAGEAKVAGGPAKVSWEENFSSKAAFDSRYTLQGRLEETQREAFGFSGAPFLSGPTETNLTYTSKGGKGALAIALDLEDSALAIPGFTWTKPAGRPGKGNIQIDFVKGKIRRIRELDITADGLDAKGTFAFAGDGKTIERASIDRLKFGVTDIQGKAVRDPGGRFNVNLVGRGFDAEKLLEREKSGVALPPLSLSVAIDRVRLGPAQQIDRLIGSMQYDGKRWNSILLDGEFEKRGTMKLAVRSEGKVRKLEVISKDAGGAVLEAFGIRRNLKGGELVISGTFHDDEEPEVPLRGRIKMKNFQALNTPLLAKLLSVASLTGILDILRGKGVEFTRLDVPFTVTDAFTTIEQGRAFGSSLGITFEGQINNVEDSVNVRGTLIPAYTINSVFGRIPLIGEILVGGEGQGVFAVSYKIEGPEEDPNVSINPLSALTPGFLRKFFDVFEEDTGTTPPPQPRSPLKPEPQP